MQMAMVNTADASDTALNWAVAAIQKVPVVIGWSKERRAVLSDTGKCMALYSPTTLPELADPIIKDAGIRTEQLIADSTAGSSWQAVIDLDEGDVMVERGHGQTAYIAAMRAHVASHFGSEIEVPAEFAFRCGYIAFYRSQQIEVYANSSYEAQIKAASRFKCRKPYEVTVLIAQKDGRQVVHDPAILS
jgi:hypothetical protein